MADLAARAISRSPDQGEVDLVETFQRDLGTFPVTPGALIRIFRTRCGRTIEWADSRVDSRWYEIQTIERHGIRFEKLLFIRASRKRLNQFDSQLNGQTVVVVVVMYMYGRERPDHKHKQTKGLPHGHGCVVVCIHLPRVCECVECTRMTLQDAATNKVACQKAG